ncbi:MAG: cell division protein FtsQ/DivIB, partial [Acidobacteriaceae bacterium]
MHKNTASDRRTGLLDAEEANLLFRSKFNVETADISDPVLDKPVDREAEKTFLRSGRRVPVRRRGGSRFGARFGLGGRWATLVKGILCVTALGLLGIAGMGVKAYLLHSSRFILQSSASIQVDGNRVVSRSQALVFFAPDMGRSILRVPLGKRKAELEGIKWVRTATVMRLWPNRLRVAVVERAPVAFALDGNAVRLVDDQGVLLNLPNATAQQHSFRMQHYSFPVLTGISASDPLPIRATRMAMYLEFIHALDADGGHISSTLSQVDLSDPEDIRAIFLGGARQPQVHFGDSNYLARYQAYQA